MSDELDDEGFDGATRLAAISSGKILGLQIVIMSLIKELTIKQGFDAEALAVELEKTLRSVFDEDKRTVGSAASEVVNQVAQLIRVISK